MVVSAGMAHLWASNVRLLVMNSLYLYLDEVLGPGREDLSGQWSVWCSRLLNLP